MEKLSEFGIIESIERIGTFYGLLETLKEIEDRGTSNFIRDRAISGIYRILSEIALESGRLEVEYGDRYYRREREERRV